MLTKSQKYVFIFWALTGDVMKSLAVYGALIAAFFSASAGYLVVAVVAVLGAMLLATYFGSVEV